MTPQQFAKIQRDFLIRTEKRSSVLLTAEFERIKREIFKYLAIIFANDGLAKIIANRNAEKFLELFLDNLSLQVENFSIGASVVVSRAQRQMINFTGRALKKFLPEIKTSIFEPDKEATQILIGRTQDGSTLRQIFQKLKQPIRELAKKSFVEGFALGESSRAIAKRLDDVADFGRYRALVISRNETVMAYRNASVNFYDEAGITEYRFLSVLDPRTCFICWSLHGTRWKLKTKPHIHTQCRCVICPVLKNDNQIKTGIELFGSLEKGVQKQILGEKRFQLFENGSYGLKDFTAIKKSKEFGNTHFVKPLDNLKQS